MDFDPRIEEAKQFLKLANEADTNNRSEALEDLKFAAGDQWPVELQNSRNLESRPVLTINKLDGYCRQVVNQIRQQRPRPKVHGMNSESDAKVAEIITGICRHIENQSDADAAYDHAFEYAVKIFTFAYDQSQCLALVAPLSCVEGIGYLAFANISGILLHVTVCVAFYSYIDFDNIFKLQNLSVFLSASFFHWTFNYVSAVQFSTQSNFIVFVLVPSITSLVELAICWIVVHRFKVSSAK